VTEKNYLAKIQYLGKELIKATADRDRLREQHRVLRELISTMMHWNLCDVLIGGKCDCLCDRLLAVMTEEE
jgi:hypothetical protein